MTTPTSSTVSTAAQPFSVETFKELYRTSRARKYLSRMETEQIHEALEHKNLRLLEPLYGVLLQEKLKDEEVVREFVMVKNRIVDGFVVQANEIHYQSLRKPMAASHDKAQKNDAEAADTMLNNL